ncbi:MAG: histidine phosphatase family protein [Devosia ginsengisoli]|nr:histidine phosphatase family protein [Devosia ginsengisoli]MCR6672018.1 histidine phosphatase family protein [Devosia ginsengisoli]
MRNRYFDHGSGDLSRATWSDSLEHTGATAGPAEFPLTEYGLGQVDRMGQVLLNALEGRDEPLQCHVSPLERAQVTASRLLANMSQMSLKTDDRLAEVSFGSWDGMTAYEISIEYPGALDGAEAFDWFFRAPDGESFEGASARLGAWLKSVSGSTIAVSHGVAGRVLMGVYLGVPRHEALRLAVPDGGLACLADGKVTFLS